MTKYSILVYHRDFASFMQRLQAEGLLDIRQNEVYSEKSDEEYYPYLQRIEKVLQAFKIEAKRHSRMKRPEKAVASLRQDAPHPDIFLEECESLLKEKQYYTDRLKDLEGGLRQAEIWGDFDPVRIASLKQETGLQLVPASASEKKFASDPGLSEAFPIQTVGKNAGEMYFIWIESSSEPVTEEHLSAVLGFPVHLHTLPEKPFPVIEAEYRQLNAEYEKTEQKIDAVLATLDLLRTYKRDLMNRLSYKTVSQNVPEQADGALRIVEGFLPTEQCAAFDAFLEREEVVSQWVPAEKLPVEESPKIPVLLRNNRFAKLFEPITLLFSLPNYREVDLTPMLAPFFMAFFGFCLGDAGYGLLLMAAALFLLKKLSGQYKSYAWLTFWFGVATVVFGSLSGTFFGISLVEIEALGKLRSYIFDSGKMMTLSLVIGAVQILFGMVMNVIRITKMDGFRYALHKVGWLAVIVCGGLLVGAPFLGWDIPQAMAYGLYVLVGAGALLALFYNTPGKNPLFNLGLGLWDTYNTVTGLVGDLLSYIRLFALGLTGGILGSVFNALALDAATGLGVPVVSQLVMLMILLFGHSLNLALCILGSVVHPLRLTFVEFYKNAGFEGGGKAYKPFRIE